MSPFQSFLIGQIEQHMGAAIRRLAEVGGDREQQAHEHGAARAEVGMAMRYMDDLKKELFEAHRSSTEDREALRRYEIAS